MAAAGDEDAEPSPDVVIQRADREASVDLVGGLPRGRQPVAVLVGLRPLPAVGRRPRTLTVALPRRNLADEAQGLGIRAILAAPCEGKSR
jgi:hypothetical protein